MSTKKYNYVALIGVDGMGNFNQYANTPNLDRIFGNGATTLKTFSMNPTISAQNWGAMLIGASPLVHKLTNGYISNNEYKNKDLTTVFYRLREKYPNMYLASCCNWNPINIGIAENGIGVEKLTADNDADVTELAIKCVAKKPGFLFVQLDETDGAGHSYDYGPHSPVFMETLQKEDANIGKIYDAYKDAGILDETLFMVIADHGGINRGHGGYTDAEKYVFFGAAGKGVKNCGIGTMVTADTAAIILYALGVDIPSYNEKGFMSQIPEGLFCDCELKYIEPKSKGYIAVQKATPDYNSKNGLSSYVAKEKTKLALFFDGKIKDETGKCSFTEIGTPKYYNLGVYGSRAEFGSVGCAYTNDLKFGSGSFTISVWLQLDSTLTEDVIVCGTNAWFYPDRSKTGFGLALRNHSTLFVIGTGEDHLDVMSPFSVNLKDGWLNRTIAVDTQKKEIRVYSDFELLHTEELPQKYILSYDRLPFTVGNDADIKQNDKTYNLLINIDDLLVFDGAMSDAEVKKLGEYYSM